MSSTLAIALVSLLHLVLLAPLAFAIWKPAAIAPIGIGYAVLIAGVATYQSGLFTSAVVPDINVPKTSEAGLSATQCTEILSLLDRSGTIVDRRIPPRMVVADGGWAQLPAEMREVVVACVQRGWPAGSLPAQVEVRP